MMIRIKSTLPFQLVCEFILDCNFVLKVSELDHTSLKYLRHEWVKGYNREGMSLNIHHLWA